MWTHSTPQGIKGPYFHHHLVRQGRPPVCPTYSRGWPSPAPTHPRLVTIHAIQNHEGDEGDEGANNTALVAIAESAAFGTLAVVAGLLLQLDPFGNAHWSLEDVSVGLTCVWPILVIDGAVLLLNHAPTQTAGSIRISKQSVQLMQLLNAVADAKRQGRPDSDSTVKTLLRAVSQLIATGRPLADDGSPLQSTIGNVRGPPLSVGNVRGEGPPHRVPLSQGSEGGAVLGDTGVDMGLYTKEEGNGGDLDASSMGLSLFGPGGVVDDGLSSSSTASPSSSSASASAESTNGSTAENSRTQQGDDESTSATPTRIVVRMEELRAAAGGRGLETKSTPQSTQDFLDMLLQDVPGAATQSRVDTAQSLRGADGMDGDGMGGPCPTAAAVFRKAGLQDVVWERDLTTGEEFVLRQIVTRDERGPFIAALHRLQRATMLDDFTRTVNPVLTLVYTLTAVGAQECAKRAILLLGVAHWIADRLYEADLVDAAGEVALGPLVGGGGQLTTWFASQVLALGGGALVLLGWGVWDYAQSVKALSTAADEASQEAQARRDASKAKYGELSSMLDDVRVQAEAEMEQLTALTDTPASNNNTANTTQQAMSTLGDIDDVNNVELANTSNAQALQALNSSTVLSSVIQDARGILKWICLGTAFIATDNLLASMAGALVMEAWVLACIRLRYDEVVAVLLKQTQELRECQRDFDRLIR